MTTKELRELDAWIGVNVFGKKSISRDDPSPTKGTEDDYFVIEFVDISCSLPHYSTDPAASMQVLEKCAEKTSILISAHGGGYLIRGTHNDGHSFNEFIDAPTIELSICLFARKLFSKL